MLQFFQKNAPPVAFRSLDCPDVAPPNQHFEPAIDPFPGLGAGYVRLVRDIGLLHLDRSAEQAAAEILNREIDGDLGPGTTGVPVRSADIAQQPIRTGWGCGLCSQQTRTSQHRGRCRTEHPTTCDHSGYLHCVPRSVKRRIWRWLSVSLQCCEEGTAIVQGQQAISILDQASRCIGAIWTHPSNRKLP